MMQRSLLTTLCVLALTTLATAQNDDEAFNERQAKSLNAFAKKAFDRGFPRIAKVVWLQTIKLYDSENEDAWTSLGYVKIGNTWNPDPKRAFPTQDTGSGSDGQPLRKSYETLKKDLANKHRQQARKWAKAGRADRANLHWRLVLRWVDEDEEARKALEHVEVGALSGTGLEKTLYDRSKMIEQVVEEQSKVDYEVNKVEGIECPPLVRAQVKYVTVQSEHFTLHGDAEEEENLLEALQWAERTAKICKVAFPWGEDLQTRWPNDWAFFTDKATYQQILKANQVPDLEWKLEHTSTSGIGNTVIAATSGKQVLLDACVRNVARPYSRLGSPAYSEGIGHTFVGRIFNNNRLFSVDLKKQQGTVASEEDREYDSPDFDVWKNLSLEMAWRSTGGVPANRLPFCETASFTNDERIKAWSFSDYMMRRDPEMLLAMDKIAQDLKKKGSKQPAEFEQRFAAKFDVTIPQLDQEWEDFWTGASPVLKAIQNNTPPLDSISKGIDKWLSEFNKARKEYSATPVKWSANLSARCKDHAIYLADNKDLRGPAAEHTQSVALGGSYVGSMFAEMALVVTGASPSKAKKVFEEWVYLPGYRDALLNNTILTVGMYADDNVLVINGVSGIGTADAANAGVRSYPPANDGGLIFDGEVAVNDLGPDMEKWLAKQGHAGKKTIGFPLTLHFGGTGGIPNRHAITCTVLDSKGNKIEGFYSYDDGSVRTTSAPGMCVFWPFEELKGKIQFQWSWGEGGRNQSVKGGFSAK